MNKNSLLSMSDLSVNEITSILEDAYQFSKTYRDWQFSKPKLVANLFFEPSTRTHYSFASAELQLGCRTIDFNASASSVVKGESLYDTVKTFEAIGMMHWLSDIHRMSILKSLRIYIFQS